MSILFSLGYNNGFGFHVHLYFSILGFTTMDFDLCLVVSATGLAAFGTGFILFLENQGEKKTHICNFTLKLLLPNLWRVEVQILEDIFSGA